MTIDSIQLQIQHGRFGQIIINDLINWSKQPFNQPTLPQLLTKDLDQFNQYVDPKLIYDYQAAVDQIVQFSTQTMQDNFNRDPIQTITDLKQLQWSLNHRPTMNLRQLSTKHPTILFHYLMQQIKVFSRYFTQIAI